MDLATPLPASDEPAVEAQIIVNTLHVLLRNIGECGDNAAQSVGKDSERYARAAEHLARALDLVADFRAR